MTENGKMKQKYLVTALDVDRVSVGFEGQEIVLSPDEWDLIMLDLSNVIARLRHWGSPESGRPPIAEICQCGSCSPSEIHRSSCAVHNMPAKPNGRCDCNPLAMKSIAEAVHNV